MTREQQLLQLALTDTLTVQRENKEKAANIYGGLCHSFPVLVRSAGLCQALAFAESKQESGEEPRKKAYCWLLKHARAVLAQTGLLTGEQTALDAVRGYELARYALATRLYLQASVFYKRFAVSVLGVEAADAADDTEGADDAVEGGA
jgi:CRISPR-associated protein Cmr5